MDDDRDIEDLLDLTDTSDSSSSTNGGVFEGHTPFVLELHDIRKDDPQPTDVAAVPGKTKKLKKKKKGQPAKEKSHSSVSSDSLSEASSVAPSIADAKEEFYDAHESYHAIAENQGLIAGATRMQAHSETSQNPKITPHGVISPDTQTTTTTSSSRREPSTISKPTLPHE